jgi:hydroxymethylpyrimidine/phosphomethylpyrimidine kinase
VHWLSGRRLDVGPVHGTGCALAAAVTAGLAHGRGLEEAVDDARRFVVEALARAEAAGSGARLLVFG